MKSRQVDSTIVNDAEEIGTEATKLSENNPSFSQCSSAAWQNIKTYTWSYVQTIRLNVSLKHPTYLLMKPTPHKFTYLVLIYLPKPTEAIPSPSHTRVEVTHKRSCDIVSVREC